LIRVSGCLSICGRAPSLSIIQTDRLIVLIGLSVRKSNCHSVGESIFQSISQWIYRSGSLTVGLPVRDSLALTFCRCKYRPLCQSVSLCVSHSAHWFLRYYGCLVGTFFYFVCFSKRDFCVAL